MTYSVTSKGQDVESLKVLEKTAREMGLETQITEEDSNDIADRKFVSPQNEAAELFLEMERKYPPRRISNDVDINGIFDEVNNMDYLFKDQVETAVAESLGCEKRYTYIKSDFKRIQKHTDLNIVIL